MSTALAGTAVTFKISVSGPFWGDASLRVGTLLGGRKSPRPVNILSCRPQEGLGGSRTGGSHSAGLTPLHAVLGASVGSAECFGQHFRGVLRVTLSIVRDELGPSPTHVLKP